MSKSSNCLILFTALLLSTVETLQGQERGNIVEYFGRETIEKIDEGEILYQFTEGLTMPTGPASGGLLPSRDIIAWALANGSMAPPQNEQAIIPAEESESNPIWTQISANNDGIFTGIEMRRSFLHTRFMAPKSQIVLLDAKGHTRLYINGMPYEGDHYDFGYTLIPVRLNRGSNDFIYTPGRFGRVASRLVAPRKPVMVSSRDLTLPALIKGESEEKWAAIRVINATEKELRNLTIKCILESGEEVSHPAGNIMEMAARKLPFKIPSQKALSDKRIVTATVILLGAGGRELDRADITLNQVDPNAHHERTFVSKIDGSIQYYSVAPSTTSGEGQALVLSVHGAGVEARNQARAYASKDWCHIVAPTNRRPFGFNWEEWGRIDALEVLEDSRKKYQTKPELTYLTGHSMGGHGTWHLGVTYPDRFAAIAPCAGYPDILGYRRGGPSESETQNQHSQMLNRSAHAARTLELKRNFLQSGIYILHGDEDTVVPVSLARMMRQTLSEFHPNFNYYEYPGGSHWYGDHSVDWHPIFSYFKWHSIPARREVKEIEFHTASPSVSASSYWVTILQQQKPLEFSSVSFQKSGDTIVGSVKNVATISFDLSELEFTNRPLVVIGGQTIEANDKKNLVLTYKSGQWIPTSLNRREKHPERGSGFKQAFDNRAVLVYATGGSRAENEWYRNKARFDAEAFLYKGNGSFEVIPDKDFTMDKYADRNVILYGNADNNRAWGMLLHESPITVRKEGIHFGETYFTGDDLAACFIYPRSDSDNATIGVIAGTGIRGMKSQIGNDYFSGVNGYPDLLIFNQDYLRNGLDGILVSGFFNNDWTIGEEFFTNK